MIILLLKSNDSAAHVRLIYAYNMYVTYMFSIDHKIHLQSRLYSVDSISGSCRTIEFDWPVNLLLSTDGGNELINILLLYHDNNIIICALDITIVALLDNDSKLTFFVYTHYT